jgi:Flp pilus assembly protein protease CpaA
MELSYLLLPAIVLFGLATSYSDIRHGKIRNRLVAAAIIYSFLATAAVTLSLVLAGEPVFSGYLPAYTVNIAAALVFGFGFWYAGLWGAGDAKLFVAYSSLVPLSFYSYGYIATQRKKRGHCRTFPFRHVVAHDAAAVPFRYRA